jgi:nitric oxide synthase oxygenase domain/subunit
MFLISQSKNNIAALELKRQLGVGYPTAWRVKHKLMQVIAEREAGRTLQGRWSWMMPTSGVSVGVMPGVVRRIKCPL